MKNKKAAIVKLIGIVAFVVLVAFTCRVTVIPDEAPQTMVNAAGETVVVEKLAR